MATVNKDFKIKHGIIVEGTTGTINGYNILTESQDGIDFIVDQIGGTATSVNTPNTVVKRDGSGNFAAGTITADITGTVSSLSNHDTDDLSEGASNKYFTEGRVKDVLTGSTQTNISITEVGGQLHITAENGVADSTTDNLTEGTSNLYFTNARVDSHLSAGNGISYNSGQIDAVIGTGLEFGITGDIHINRTTVDTWYDASGAASTVQGNLEDHASDTSTHGVTGAIVGTTDTQTISNKTLGSDLAAGGYKVSGLATPTSNADAATKSYVDTAVANLVDSAPALLDTLNELAAAIGDDANFVSTVTTSIGEKVAKAGDSMTGNLDFGGTNKVTSLATPTSSGDAANKLYVDTEVSNAIDATTYTAGTNIDITANVVSVTGLDTDDVSEGTNLYFTNQRALDATSAAYDISGAAATAQSNAETFATNAINALDTDDIEEGMNNLYHTDARAKSAAADLLVNANKTNIQITGTGAGLTITAENGVADSTTDDLDEGATNLYFTDQRAIDALQDTTPNFVAVEINSLAKQVAATTSVPTASTITAYSFAKADYRSAKFLVKTAYGSHTELTEILLTLDTSDNIAITEYATVGTNGSSMTVTADVDGSNARLRVTTANNNSTVTVMGTLLA